MIIAKFYSLEYHLSEISCKPAKKQKSECNDDEDDSHSNSTEKAIITSDINTSLPDFKPPPKIQSKVPEDLCPNNLVLTVKLKDNPNSNVMRNPTSILTEQAQKDGVDLPKVTITPTGPYFYAEISFRGKKLNLTQGFKKKDNARHNASKQMIMKVYGVLHDWKPTGIDAIAHEMKTGEIDLPKIDDHSDIDEELYKKAYNFVNPKNIGLAQAIQQKIKISRYFHEMKNSGNKLENGLFEYKIIVTKNKKIKGRNTNDLVVSSVCRTKQEAKNECFKKIIIAIYKDLGG